MSAFSDFEEDLCLDVDQEQRMLFVDGINLRSTWRPSAAVPALEKPVAERSTNLKKLCPRKSSSLVKKDKTGADSPYPVKKRKIDRDPVDLILDKFCSPQGCQNVEHSHSEERLDQIELSGKTLELRSSFN